MRTMKILSIIGLVLAGFSIIIIMAAVEPDDYTGLLGWLFIDAMYMIAFGVVGIVQANKLLK